MQIASSKAECVGGDMTQGSQEEIFSVKEHELTFRHMPDSKANNRRFSRYADGRNHVFSALNGLGDDADIALAGVAQGSCAGVHDRMLPQGFAILREGVASVVNTGQQTITVGDAIYWRFPNIRKSTDTDTFEFLRNEKYANGVTILGVPRGKRCAQLMGSNETDNYVKTLTKFDSSTNSNSNLTDGEKIVWKQKHRVGYALSRAEPGKQLDMIFQPGY